MPDSKCDLSNPNFSYPYCPSLAAAILFAVLFTFPTVGHVIQAIQYRKPFAMVLIMGGLWELGGYVVRTLSINSPFDSGLDTTQVLLIVLAPLWINAFMYMLVGRMIHFFLDDDRIFRLKARKLTLIFVVFDITAFVVQAWGASQSSDSDINTAKNGLRIYTGGVALQILFNIIFLVIVAQFQKIATPILQGSKSSEQERFLHIVKKAPNSLASNANSFQDCIWLLRLVYGVTAIILFRNIYRLAEFAAGIGNTIATHEWFAYVFDAVPMLTVFIIMNIFHPGKKLQGPRCDFSEENAAIKQKKKEKKAAKKAGKGNRKNVDFTKNPNFISQKIWNYGKVPVNSTTHEMPSYTQNYDQGIDEVYSHGYGQA